jgi:ABC-type uncharacterized transport system substrate-binding protein
MGIERVLGRAAAAAAFMVAVTLGATVPGMAHPHIWVRTSSEVLFENGAIVALRHAWTFDEYYSQTAVDGLDTDKDGTYSRAELAELAKVNVEALKDFAYFTFPRLASQDLTVGTPKDYWLEHGPVAAAGETPAAGATAGAAGDGASGIIARGAEAKAGGVLTLRFTLPLAQPVLADAPEFSFTVGDPTFFIAFDPAPGTAVTLGPGAPPDCRVVAADAPPQEGGNPGKPGDLMAPQQAPGFSFAQAAAWKVVCKRPS